MSIFSRESSKSNPNLTVRQMQALCSVAEHWLRSNISEIRFPGGVEYINSQHNNLDEQLKSSIKKYEHFDRIKYFPGSGFDTAAQNTKNACNNYLKFFKENIYEKLFEEEKKIISLYSREKKEAFFESIKRFRNKKYETAASEEIEIHAGMDI